MPSIVKFLIVAMSLLESKTKALLAAAVPGVTLSRTPISAVVIVVVSNVIAPQLNVPTPDILLLVSIVTPLSFSFLLLPSDIIILLALAKILSAVTSPIAVTVSHTTLLLLLSHLRNCPSVGVSWPIFVTSPLASIEIAAVPPASVIEPPSFNIKLPDVVILPDDVIASVSNVPYIYASLNFWLLEPKSISLSVIGNKAPSTNLIWLSPRTLNMIFSFVAKLILLSVFLPVIKEVFNIDVSVVWAAVTEKIFPDLVIPSPLLILPALENWLNVSAVVPIVMLPLVNWTYPVLEFTVPCSINTKALSTLSWELKSLALDKVSVLLVKTPTV